MQYDGHFLYEKTVIMFQITDNDRPINKSEKISRYIHFYRNNESLGFVAIYGHTDQLCNITPQDALQWYLEGKKAGHVK